VRRRASPKLPTAIRFFTKPPPDCASIKPSFISCTACDSTSSLRPHFPAQREKLEILNARCRITYSTRCYTYNGQGASTSMRVCRPRLDTW